MFKKNKVKKSNEATELASELRSWSDQAAKYSKQAWYKHIEDAQKYFENNDYLSLYLKIKDARDNGGEMKDFFSEVLKHGGQLIGAKEEWEKSNNHDSIKNIAVLDKAINELFLDVFKICFNYQEELEKDIFNKIRAGYVESSVIKEQKEQSIFSCTINGVKDAILDHQISQDIAISLLFSDRFNDFSYIELSGEAFRILNNDKELTSLLGENKSDLTLIGGLVSHDAPVIAQLCHVLNINKYIDAPLILLKKNYNTSTLIHELTHACIHNIDCYIHLYNRFNKTEYHNNPEERLAFINEIIYYQFLNPADDFDEYLRIQAKMNIDSNIIVEQGASHVKFLKELWFFLKSKGEIKKSNILSLQAKAVDKFVAPTINESSYILFASRNKEHNERLYKAYQSYVAGDYHGAVNLYGESFKASPFLRKGIQKHYVELKMFLTHQGLQEGDKLIKEGKKEEAIKFFTDALNNAKKENKDTIKTIISRITGQDYIDQTSDKEYLTSLIEDLFDNDPELRQKAAIELGKTGDSKATIPLIEKLSDDKWFVRKRAAEALGLIGDEKAVEPLTKSIQHYKEDSNKKWVEDYLKAAVIALREIGQCNKQTSNVLFELLVRTGWGGGHLNTLTAEALKKIAHDETLNYMFKNLKVKRFDFDETHYKKRSNVVVALESFGGHPYAKPLIKMLKKDNTTLLESGRVDNALARIVTKNHVKKLIKLLSLYQIRLRITMTLCKNSVTGKIMNKIWGEAMYVTDWEERAYIARRAAAKSLGKIGDRKAVEPLIRTLEMLTEIIEIKYSRDYLVHVLDVEVQGIYYNSTPRVNIVRALGEIGDKKAIYPLINALSDRDTSMRKESLNALEKIGDLDPEVMKPLIEKLSSMDSNVRVTAANELLKISNS